MLRERDFNPGCIEGRLESTTELSRRGELLSRLGLQRHPDGDGGRTEILDTPDRGLLEHGGSIEVTDNTPSGTRFTVELPCADVLPGERTRAASVAKGHA